MEVFNLLSIAFNWFMDNTLFNVPILYLILGAAFIGLIINFVKGKRT